MIRGNREGNLGSQKQQTVVEDQTMEDQTIEDQTMEDQTMKRTIPIREAMTIRMGPAVGRRVDAISFDQNRFQKCTILVITWLSDQECYPSPVQIHRIEITRLVYNCAFLQIFLRSSRDDANQSESGRIAWMMRSAQ